MMREVITGVVVVVLSGVGVSCRSTTPQSPDKTEHRSGSFNEIVAAAQLASGPTTRPTNIVLEHGALTLAVSNGYLVAAIDGKPSEPVLFCPAAINPPVDPCMATQIAVFSGFSQLIDWLIRQSQLPGGENAGEVLRNILDEDQLSLRERATDTYMRVIVSEKIRQKLESWKSKGTRVPH